MHYHMASDFALHNSKATTCYQPCHCSVATASTGIFGESCAEYSTQPVSVVKGLENFQDRAADVTSFDLVAQDKARLLAMRH